MPIARFLQTKEVFPRVFRLTHSREDAFGLKKQSINQIIQNVSKLVARNAETIILNSKSGSCLDSSKISHDLLFSLFILFVALECLKLSPLSHSTALFAFLIKRRR